MVRITNLQTGRVTNTNRMLERRVGTNVERSPLTGVARRFVEPSALAAPLTRFERFSRGVRTAKQNVVFRMIFGMFMFAALLTIALKLLSLKKKINESDVEKLVNTLVGLLIALNRTFVKKVLYAQWVETSILLFLKYAPTIVTVLPITSMFPRPWITSITAGIALRKGINRTPLKPIVAGAETIEKDLFDLYKILRDAFKDVNISVEQFQMLVRALDLTSGYDFYGTVFLSIRALIITMYRTAYFLAVAQAGRVGMEGLIALVKVTFGYILNLRKVPTRATQPRDVQRFEKALEQAEKKAIKTKAETSGNASTSRVAGPSHRKKIKAPPDDDDEPLRIPSRRRPAKSRQTLTDNMIDTEKGKKPKSTRPPVRRSARLSSRRA